MLAVSTHPGKYQHQVLDCARQQYLIGLSKSSGINAFSWRKNPFFRNLKYLSLPKKYCHLQL
jgi:hypothetical protein